MNVVKPILNQLIDIFHSGMLIALLLAGLTKRNQITNGE